MPDDLENDVSHKNCEICSSLLDAESAFQKYGWAQDNTYLPAAAGHLKVIRDFQPWSSRKLQLQQCPACGTYFLYKTDYEYLVNGSEDEESLVRLTLEEASKYLDPSTGGTG